MKKIPETEKALAAKVVAWLQRESYETWEEVVIGSRRVDIVARRGPAIIAIECKTSLSLAVLEQAAYWSGIAHQSYAAVPSVYRRRGGLHAVCLAIGCGVLEVGGDVTVRYHAPFIRRALTHNITKHLTDGNRSGNGYAGAGSAGGGYWTPWQQTIRDLTSYINAHPGMTLGDALKRITHHYSTDSTARSSLSHWLRVGKIPGIETRRDGRALRLYPLTTQAQAEM